MTDCTERFNRYRDLSRMVWNVGFYSDLSRDDYVAIAAYKDVLQRLFEVMVAMPLSQEGQDPRFRVIINRQEIEFLVARSLPEEHDGRWQAVSYALVPDSYEFLFMDYFDWDQLAPKDCRYIRALIVRLDSHPDLVGRQALIEATECSVFLV